METEINRSKLLQIPKQHLIVGLLPVQQEVDGLPYLLAVDLAVQIFGYHLRPLLRCDIAEYTNSALQPTKKP